MVRLIEQFLVSKRSENTRKTYRSRLSQFAGWLNGRDLGELRARDFGAYQRTLFEQGASPATVKLNLAAVRSFLRFLVREERVSERVLVAAQAVEPVKLDEPLPKTVSEDVLEDVLCQPDTYTEDGRRDVAFMLLLKSSGLRVSEAVSINIEDLAGRSVVVVGKGRKERRVFFDSRTEAALGQYLLMRDNPKEGALFTNKFGRRVSVRWMQQRVREYGLKAGEALHPHRLRHTFATELLDRTGDIHLVSQLCGHSNTAVTVRYTRSATKRSEAAYRAAMDTISEDVPRIRELVWQR